MNHDSAGALTSGKPVHVISFPMTLTSNCLWWLGRTNAIAIWNLKLKRNENGQAIVNINRKKLKAAGGKSPLDINCFLKK